MKYENTAIILTFFSLWLAVSFTNPSQEVIAVFFIFSFGILHGSNDLSLIAKVSNASKPLHLALFISSYVVTVVVASLLFYYIPIIALAAFIIFSAFHFGEQHWSAWLKNTSKLNRFFFLNYGLALLFLLFYLNTEATRDIVFSLTKLNIPEQWFLWTCIASSSLWLMQALLLVYRKSISLQQLVFESFMFLVFAIVFKTATLIWAFAIYFIFWHSIPSLCDQVRFIHKDLNFRAFGAYGISALPYWLVSMGGLIGLYLLFNDQKYFISLLNPGIDCIQ